MDNLKPCPFCGCEKPHPSPIVVWCPDCDAEGPHYVSPALDMDHNESIARAIAAWNTRAESKEIERLRERIWELENPLPANGEGWDKPPTISEFPQTIQWNAT